MGWEGGGGRGVERGVGGGDWVWEEVYINVWFIWPKNK